VGENVYNGARGKTALPKDLRGKRGLGEARG